MRSRKILHDIATNTSIRKAKTNDCKQLSALTNQLGYPCTPGQVRKTLKHILNDKDHCILVALLPDSSVCAWIHAHIYRLFYAAKMVEISGLVVDENHRGKGIGRKLMQRVERWAKMKDCQLVSLRTNIIRKQAHIFYEKLGYKKIKIQYTFRKLL